MNAEALSVLESLTHRLALQAGCGHWQQAADTQTGRRQMLSPGLPGEPDTVTRLRALLTAEASILQLATSAREALLREWQASRRQQAAGTHYQAIDVCADCG